jgi:hypothetical protein
MTAAEIYSYQFMITGEDAMMAKRLELIGKLMREDVVVRGVSIEFYWLNCSTERYEQCLSSAYAGWLAH